MKKNMYMWLENIRTARTKKPLPILSFPAIQLTGINVIELISDSELQAKSMKLVADRCDTAASVSLMDLSVEAEAFGATIRFSESEVPTVTGRLIDTAEQADALKVPDVGAGRTGLYIEAIGKAAKLITDRPVFAGVIGPFSLSGRLMDMTEIMIKCFTEPETVHTVLAKAAEFAVKYILAYKAAGANGVVIAEPAAGLLSPKFNDEFSTHYVRKIIEAVQDENFIVVYHNCGNTIPLIKSILTNGARIYHFGNAINMEEMLKLVPEDRVVMGNVEPAGQFRNGTPESVYQTTTALMERCASHRNWVPSSGCDIPPLSPWANIDAFFKAAKDYYAAHNIIEIEKNEDQQQNAG
jgi:uroporphyrinogen decarboxylase